MLINEAHILHLLINAILLVFDITNASSFISVQEWMNKIRPFFPEKTPVIGLLANKCDMEHQRAVTVERQTRFACEHSMLLHNVSARTGENIMLCFQHVLTDILCIKLTRAQKEEQRSVVKAEIPSSNHNQVFAGMQTPPSTVCSLQ
uniref:Ras-related protein Rab-28 n=1 Tax=Clastoptera arizonana TaxID=38151 RepID=A0A1B6DSK0_9HEMI